MTDLERGRELYGQRAWAAAHEALARADRSGTLAGEDLERLALAAYFIGRDADYLEQLQRAYHAYRAENAAAPSGARGVLAGIAPAVQGRGRARERLVRPRAAAARSAAARLRRAGIPVARGRRVADRRRRSRGRVGRPRSDAATMGERFAEADVVAVAHHLLGRIRLRQGGVQEGLALLDEAMVAVTGGELSPMVTGLLYCSVIDACQEVCALERAHEWTSALAGWCDAATRDGRVHGYLRRAPGGDPAAAWRLVAGAGRGGARGDALPGRQFAGRGSGVLPAGRGPAAAR